MDKRLKKIWSGFEETTDRRLTGGGVDNIIVPHRMDYIADDKALLTAEYSAPAQAAFAALRDRLAAQEKNYTFKFGKRSQNTDRHFSDAEPFPTEELVTGMRATALRTQRPDTDYSAFMETDAGKAALKRHQKKKRFGIF